MQIIFINRFELSLPSGWETIINIMPKRTLKLPFFSTANSVINFTSKWSKKKGNKNNKKKHTNNNHITK